MNSMLKNRLDRAFSLTMDLLLVLEENNLFLDLPNLPSNKVADQFWCIVGARESYINAIKSDGWQGFTCSLKAPINKDGIVKCFNITSELFCAIDFMNLTNNQLKFAFDLLEHEIQHHGQLIRYMYGNKLSFPISWNKRYTV